MSELLLIVVWKFTHPIPLLQRVIHPVLLPRLLRLVGRVCAPFWSISKQSIGKEMLLPGCDWPSFTTALCLPSLHSSTFPSIKPGHSQGC